MQIDLQVARAAREVEDLVKTALSRLPPLAQKDVLQRVALDVVTAIEADQAKARGQTVAPAPTPVAPAARRAKPAAPALALVPAPPPDDDRRQWERVLAYCQANPSPTGEYRTADVAEAVFPDKARENRNATMSMIYTTIKRRAVAAGPVPPYFVLIGQGKFRLATAEERATSA